ncbi:MAG: ribosome maturation factor RimM [Anaerolineales bacterium]
MMNQGKDTSDPGSPSGDTPEFVAVGKLRKPHGVRGEMVMTVVTDFPELLSPGQRVFVGEDYGPLTVRSVRWHRNDILIAFEGYDDRDQVGVYRNYYLFMRAEDLPALPEEEYYFHELIGLDVVSDTGQRLGTVKDILATGANDVYVVERQGKKDILLPAIEEVILEIMPEEGIMKVHLLPGLVEE